MDARSGGEAMSQLSWTPPAGGSKGVTLETHIMEGMLGSAGATGAFTSLLNLVGLAAKLVSSRVRAAGLADVLGWTGKTNVQGEEVQKLDEYANDVFCTVLSRRSHCAFVASEELDEPLASSTDPRAKYVVMMDPLDGSSNIDVNVSIGTIFAIGRRSEDPGATPHSHFFKPGRELIAAGYVIYGSSTMLVYTTGKGGVHGFTYDPGVGEFFLSHENIRCPERGKTYSINEGNSALWSDPVRRWNAWVKEENKAEGRPYGQRYVGSLIADAHRTLLKGGIFAYPADKKSAKGKLRLLYEANPFAFLFEAAGGAAIDGSRRILDVEPTELHQRTPLILGSREDVKIFGEFMDGKR
jgi:fructose-1,6-bisphosphatase I